MNKPHKKNRASFALLAGAAVFFAIPAAVAAISTYTGHDFVSVTSAVSVAETNAVRFGNFAVASPGDAGASITLSDTGTRTVSNTGVTTITLINGGFSDTGSQGPGYYQLTGAVANATVYVTFTDSTGAAISSSNPVVLTGPVGSGTFNVDTMTFNQSGSDVTGPYIIASATGTATIQVGATLHTVAGVSTYAAGTYRGTFNLIVSY